MVWRFFLETFFIPITNVSRKEQLPVPLLAMTAYFSGRMAADVQ